MKATTCLLALAALGVWACDFNITDPNSPGPIGTDPSRADAADWNLDAGILGREAYRFDGSDPRFISEFLNGPLDPGGGAFGGDHWIEEYNAILSANQLLDVIGTASRLTTAEQDATRGVVKTLKAYA